MRLTELEFPALQIAAAQIPANVPVMMLNLVRYKPEAITEDGIPLPYASGRSAYYEGYVPAFQQVAKDEGIEGIQLFWGGEVLANLVAAPNEQWDEVVLVEYPDFAAFMAIAQSAGYANNANPLRLAAVDDCRLIAMTKTF
jgi:hypothetical protein